MTDCVLLDQPSRDHYDFVTLEDLRRKIQKNGTALGAEGSANVQREKVRTWESTAGVK